MSNLHILRKQLQGLGDSAAWDSLLDQFSNKPKTETGTTYELRSGDHNKIIYLDNASAITVTIPAGLPKYFSCTLVKQGAGNITVSSSGTLQSSGTTIATQYEAATVYHKGADVHNVWGNLT